MPKVESKDAGILTKVSEETPFVATSMSIFLDRIVLRDTEGRTKEFKTTKDFVNTLKIELRGK